MLVVGSKGLAICLHATRPPKDTDIIAFPAEAEEFVKQHSWASVIPTQEGKKLVCRDPNGLMTEIELAWPDSSAAYILNNYKNVTLDLLLTLKMSHRFLSSPHFRKTWYDIKFLRDNGAVIHDSYLLKMREKETYIKRLPKLNVDKSNFFDPATFTHYIYDHDTIHLAMAEPLKPAYQSFQNGEVWCSKEQFFNIDEATRQRSVLEEAYVLALERSQIPFEFKVAPAKSFRMAIEKICTTISSGWWREYAWQNYPLWLEIYDQNYVSKFKDGLVNGIVKPFQHKG